jgi:GntR family transcriptional regulator, transcriptional repressor for pyruvate dehydrogenase complex
LPSERELAATFAVSRRTIQQAMRLLEANRLVKAKRGRYGGTFVLGVEEEIALVDDRLTHVLRSRADIEELIVYRLCLEPAVAALAATTYLGRDVKSMRRAVSEMDDAATDAEWMRLDTEFHLAVARATHNQLIVGQIEKIRLGLNEVIALLPESDRWHSQMTDEHAAIIDAIESADEDTARAAMCRHVRNSRQAVIALLTTIGRRWSASRDEAIAEPAQES